MMMMRVLLRRTDSQVRGKRHSLRRSVSPSWPTHWLLIRPASCIAMESETDGRVSEKRKNENRTRLLSPPLRVSAHGLNFRHRADPASQHALTRRVHAHGSALCDGPRLSLTDVEHEAAELKAGKRAVFMTYCVLAATRKERTYSLSRSWTSVHAIGVDRVHGPQ